MHGGMEEYPSMVQGGGQVAIKKGYLRNPSALPCGAIKGMLISPIACFPVEVNSCMTHFFNFQV